MTRINTIDVKDLADQHLMAEYRELPMVHGSLKRSKRSKNGVRLDRIPTKYTLNAGHVSFWYNKGKWLKKRWDSLIAELRYRGYNIDPDSRVVDWSVFDSDLNNDWTIDDTAHSINIERIIFRLNEKKSFYRYYKEPITDNYIKLLENKYL